MSYKKAGLYPSNPVTARGASTKLSSGKDKVVYTSGRTVLVRSRRFFFCCVDHAKWFLHLFRYAISRLDAQGLICWIARSYEGCPYPEPRTDDILLWAYTERDCSASLSVGILLRICRYYGEGWVMISASPFIMLIFVPVNVWDTVGEDQVVKGEYRVISGRVYVSPSTRNEGSH